MCNSGKLLKIITFENQFTVNCQMKFCTLKNINRIKKFNYYLKVSKSHQFVNIIKTIPFQSWLSLKPGLQITRTKLSVWFMALTCMDDKAKSINGIKHGGTYFHWSHSTDERWWFQNIGRLKEARIICS